MGQRTDRIFGAKPTQWIEDRHSYRIAVSRNGLEETASSRNMTLTPIFSGNQFATHSGHMQNDVLHVNLCCTTSKIVCREVL